MLISSVDQILEIVRIHSQNLTLGGSVLGSRSPGDNMNQATAFLNKYVVPPLTVVSENTYMKAIRAGMVAIVPLAGP